MVAAPAVAGARRCPGFPARAAAQSPEQRASLEAFRDSIGTTVDSIGLEQLEDKLIAAAKADRNDPMRHLRLGFLALRLGDLRGVRGTTTMPPPSSSGRSTCSPSWPYAWYGMGLAEYGIGDSQVTVVAGLKTMFGKDALARSAAAFAKTAEVDPSFVRGLVELSNTALRQRVNIKLDVALDALRRASATTAGSNPQVLLARGRVEREVGSPDSAVAAFTRYLATDGPKAIGQLELARTQLWQGDRLAAAGYYTSAASDDSAVVAIIRNDLFPIAADTLLADYDSKRGIHRAAWLQQFWGTRDDLEMGYSGDRLVEHYRRWFYARRNFALVTVSRHYKIEERYKSGSQDFDDRGIIYVRHGDPTIARHLQRLRCSSIDGPGGAEHLLVLRAHRRQHVLPLRRPGGCAGLPARGEPLRCAGLPAGAAAPDRRRRPRRTTRWRRTC